MRTSALLALCSLVAALPAAAATLPVPSPTYPTIQSALDDTEVGDTVLVAPGTYTGAENRDLRFLGRDVVLLAAGGSEATLIDCEGQGRGFTFISGETPASWVVGFTIIHGFSFGSGGAFFCNGTSPTVVGCRMTDNHGAPGGAVSAVSGATPVFTGCTLEGNQSAEAGGAIHVSFASPVFIDCTIRGNRSEETGGGAAVYSTGTTTFTACLVTGNSAPDGAGLAVRFGAAALLFAATLGGNDASGNGGAIWLESGVIDVQNSIVWANCAGSGPAARVENGSTLGLACSFFNPDDIAGSGTVLAGDGTSSENPLFCRPLACGEAPSTGGNYGLLPSSPAVSSMACGAIGALGVACEDVPVVHTTWGALKARSLP